MYMQDDNDMYARACLCVYVIVYFGLSSCWSFTKCLITCSTKISLYRLRTIVGCILSYLIGLPLSLDYYQPVANIYKEENH